MLRLVTFLLVFAAVAVGVVLGGQWGAKTYQRLMAERLEQGLGVLGMGWVEARIDGLQVELRGEAPDPDQRSLMLSTARAALRSAAIVDLTTARPQPSAPRTPIQVELLREDGAITLTGRLSGADMQAEFTSRLAYALPHLELQDLTGRNAAPVPKTWGAEIDLAVTAAARLNSAHVTIAPGAVAIRGVAADAELRSVLQKDLIAQAGDAIALSLDLNVPSAVAIPFRFAASKDFGGIRIETCAARDEDERAGILGGLGRHGVADHASTCPVALGGPDGAWAAAVMASLTALDALPAGHVDLIYRTLHIDAAPPSEPADLDRVEAALTDALPQGFALRTRLTDETPGEAVPRDAYWLSFQVGPGAVILDGRVPGAAEQNALTTYAAALTRRSAVTDNLQIAQFPPPPGWHNAAQQVLTSLAAIEHGTAQITAGRVALSARVTDPNVARDLHRDLAALLPSYAVSSRIEIDLPSAIRRMPLAPVDCVVELNRLLRADPLIFETGSAVIDRQSVPLIDALAGTFGRCEDTEVEIGGHTDSQGSESFNLGLSQARADALLTALSRRAVPLDRLSAKGYGESAPIASNETEVGRAQNRRIEFRSVE